MNKDDISKCVKQLYAARLANNAEQCLQCFSPSGIFTMAGEDNQVYQAEQKTPPSMREQLDALVAAWDWQAIDHQRIIVDGNQAAVSYQLTAVFKPTEERICTQISDHLCFDDDGKLIEFIEFIDTAMVQRLVSSAGKQQMKPADYYP